MVGLMPVVAEQAALCLLYQTDTNPLWMLTWHAFLPGQVMNNPCPGTNSFF